MYTRIAHLEIVYSLDLAQDEQAWFCALQHYIDRAEQWANEGNRRRIPGPVCLQFITPCAEELHLWEYGNRTRRLHITVPFVMVDVYRDAPTLQYGTCSQCNAENALIVEVYKFCWLCVSCKRVRDTFYGTEFYKDNRGSHELW
jgi:hypothetical protein